MHDFCQHPTRLIPMLTLVALLCGCYETAAFKETRTQSLAYVPDTPVHVKTANGAITINQSDRDDIEIVAHVQAVSDERLKGVEIVAERVEGDALSVWAKWPDGKRRNSEGCSFEVLVPGANGVGAQTSNGKVNVSGLAGTATLNTSNGAIDLGAHEGPVSAHTSNGAISLTDIAGTIDAQSSNGRISVKSASGAVTARTSNGRIEVELASTSPGPVNATTSNGSIDLKIGPSFAGTLALETSNGSFDSQELPEATLVSSSKNHLELAFGNADHASHLRTSNGSIRLNRLSK